MLIEILICGALAILAGAMADKAEKERSFFMYDAIFILLALGFCGLALWAGLAWVIQIKGAL